MDENTLTILIYYSSYNILTYPQVWKKAYRQGACIMEWKMLWRIQYCKSLWGNFCCLTYNHTLLL